MKKNTKVWILVAIIAFVLIFVFRDDCIAGNCTTDISNNLEMDAFAQYLTDQGIAMAGTEWCSHCKEQKSYFEDSFKYVDYHDCDKDGAWCSSHNIQGYPTWVFPDGQLYPGTKTIGQLKSLSGYTD